MALAFVIIMFVFGLLANAGLYALADYVGQWTFIAVGFPIVAAIAVGGITYDRAYVKRLAQQSRPEEP
jgi:hypothetical protein